MQLLDRCSVTMLTVAAIFGAVAAPCAHAEAACSNRTLNGSYGLHATGTVIGVGDFAAVGRFTFDGNGGLTGTLFVRVNGSNNEITIRGNYTVSPDCLVSDTWNISDGSTSTHKSIIVDDGRGYLILNNTVGDPNVISGEARKQFIRGRRDDE